MPIMPALQLAGRPWVSGFVTPSAFVHGHFHEGRPCGKPGTELAFFGDGGNGGRGSTPILSRGERFHSGLRLLASVVLAV